MRNLLIFVAGVALIWGLMQHPKADWVGMRTPDDPVQVEEKAAHTWQSGKFILTARAKYHIRAVVLSKHSYWSGSDEDKLAPYDLALGWGPMSDALVINQLDISQGGRWYQYYWKDQPPIEQGEIITHSANTHILPATSEVLKRVKQVRRHDVVEMDGFLVDSVSQKSGATLKTSLSRSDSGAGSCEVFWVTGIKIVK